MKATTSATASTSSPSSESILSSLISRGWHFRDTDQIHLLITAQLSPNCTVDSIESELVNMDLRSIGGKCLPQPSSLAKVSHLQGPIVLQVCSSRDITRSSIADVSENSGNRRLLRLKLTDGHSEITAVEYHHVPAIPDDISPGTKVRLQNKADICSGILCLNKKVISVIGGLVESLYEEWQLKRKYLNVSRQNLRLSQENASSYPPPFEKLQIQAAGRKAASGLHTSATKGMHSSLDTSGVSSTSLNDRPKILAVKGESSILSQSDQLQKNKATVDSVTHEVKLLNTNIENTATSSSSRPKVTASVPVQNQMAAQKLLQKTSQPNVADRNFRSHRRRGKYEEDDSSVLTLDEWERRKTGIDLSTAHEHSNLSRDEDLARQLQEQFDLEDNHAQNDPHMMEAKNITMSMFNFERDDAGASGRTGFRGRGRGRGRGRRGGGRGRGRF